MITEKQYPSPHTTGFSPARGIDSAASNQPQEPCLHAKADETLRFISELEYVQGRVEAYLYGERIEDGNKPVPTPVSLEGKMAEACTRAACLVSQSRTMLRNLCGAEA
jgi:hypothetical protein